MKNAKISLVLTGILSAAVVLLGKPEAAVVLFPCGLMLSGLFVFESHVLSGAEAKLIYAELRRIGESLTFQSAELARRIGALENNVNLMKGLGKK